MSLIMKNIFEEFYGQLIDSVKSLNDPSASSKYLSC